MSHYLPALCASAIVLICTAAVASLGAVTTAGGNDQRAFHLPSVLMIRDSFPTIDIIGLPTATGPLYHLLVAAISGPFALGEAGTQLVAAVFAAALAGLTVQHAQSLPTTQMRLLAVSPLLLSAYFWQSALWMLTDDAALLFAMGALILLGRTLTTRRLIVIGVLITAAIATRQTTVWILAPAIAMCWYEFRDRSWRSSVGATAWVSVPGILTLAVLMALWGGLTPPAMRQFNAATPSWTSISFTFAVAAIFAVPILAATRRAGERHLPTAALVGTVAAAPAIVFASAATSFPDDSRRGGVVWSLVAHFPDISGRSPLLAALAFVGGFAGTLVFHALDRRTAIMLASGLTALAIAIAPGSQLYQKYAELPVAAMAVLAIVALGHGRGFRRSWPLWSLTSYQALSTAGIVAVPILRALSG
jgi:hypothetical protein